MRGDEALVVGAFCRWLESNGWAVRTEVEGVDVLAKRGVQRLYAEAKGRTEAPGLDVDTAFGQLLRRMPPDDAPSASYALVVRDEPNSVRAAIRVPTRVLTQLRIALYAVDAEGVVRELAAR